MQSAGRTASILVVDDDRILCRFLARFLSGEGYAIASVHNGQAMRRAFADAAFDLVILDLGFPHGEDGMTLARRLRAQYDTPLIVLSGKSTTIDKVVCLELGADDYVTKPFSPGELVARVRATLRRASGQVGPATVIRAGDVELDTAALTGTVAGQPVDLTPTEFQLLATLVRQPGRIFSREQLLEAVHGVAFDGYDRSVDSHIKNLRRKIEPDPRQPRYIHTVYGVGYRFEDR
jgi:two-component system OmpR family response regulator